MILGHFYCLPQSPQQFKQLLMVAGTDRYFQIARCYRDEISNPERQPEFTQIDLEISFATIADIQKVVENFIIFSWPENLEDQKPAVPFPKLKFEDAMKFYGVDKPDLRFDWKIEEISELKEIFFEQKFEKFEKSDAINALIIPEGISGGISEENFGSWKKILQLQHYFATEFQVFGGDRKKIPKEIQEKLKPAENDLVVVSWGKIWKVQKTLGFLRIQAAAALENLGKKIYKSGFHFVWISDFPLFSQNETKKIESSHHPFTAPIAEDEPRLFSDPLSVTGQHFDLVLNGVELGGGSIRIHNAEIQKRVLEEILCEDSSTLHHLINALASGAPPHGGIALGLDRYVAILCGAKSIRDVL